MNDEVILTDFAGLEADLQRLEVRRQLIENLSRYNGKGYKIYRFGPISHEVVLSALEYQANPPIRKKDIRRFNKLLATMKDILGLLNREGYDSLHEVKHANDVWSNVANTVFEDECSRHQWEEQRCPK